ncbi:flagellar hook basal-body protein [Lentisphaerota bacterium WC36G]|nr:flagellar hook basal-body protein [Lentisphaerae bacterium WC36]
MSIESVYNTVSSLEVEQTKHRILAENIAAADLAGFKKKFIISESASGKSHDLAGLNQSESKIDFSQGNLKFTERPLDFAINGEGFFEVKNSQNQSMYTRNGAFLIDQNRRLVTNEGFTVEGDSGEIIFNENDSLQNIEITEDGLIKVLNTTEGLSSYRIAGRLNVVQINNKQDLQRLTGNYFNSTGKLQKFRDEQPFTVKNKALEMSNVKPIFAMSEMVESSRMFETGQKLMKMLEDRYQAERRNMVE